jgi:hypothetical protein
MYTLQYWCNLSQSWEEYQGDREYYDPNAAAEACILLAAAMGRPCRVVDDWGNVICQY